jgi:hypothetical protein
MAIWRPHADGRLRFYLTFMVGPQPPLKRLASVRLQLDRDGRTTHTLAKWLKRGCRWPLRISTSRQPRGCDAQPITLALPGASGTLVLQAAAGQRCRRRRLPARADG